MSRLWTLTLAASVAAAGTAFARFPPGPHVPGNPLCHFYDIYNAGPCVEQHNVLPPDGSPPPLLPQFEGGCGVPQPDSNAPNGYSCSGEVRFIQDGDVEKTFCGEPKVPPPAGAEPDSACGETYVHCATTQVCGPGTTVITAPGVLQVTCNLSVPENANDQLTSETPQAQGVACGPSA